MNPREKHISESKSGDMEPFKPFETIVPDIRDGATGFSIFHAGV